jgi:outer membrane protein assembly factor BamB
MNGTRTRAAGPALRVRWTRDLAPPFTGTYVPVERAAAALDPDGARVYVGSNRGVLWALRQDGTPLFEHATDAGIEAAPAIDGARGEVYLATVRGEVRRLDAGDGTMRWRAQVGGPVSAAPLLTDDAVYVATDEDGLVALARKDGSVLWRYRRERGTGLAIQGRAGLTRTPHGIVTGFEDGAIVMLDAGDGRVVWEFDSSDAFGDDAANFVDVDTTPAFAGDVVYVASFTGGAYALNVQGGGVEWHDPKLTGVTHVAATEDVVLLASAERGIVCLDRATYAPRWVQAPERGAPGAIHLEHGVAYVAETLGAFRAFALATGRERGRLETSHGITSPPSLARGQGYVLSNAGRLFALAY